MPTFLRSGFVAAVVMFTAANTSATHELALRLASSDEESVRAAIDEMWSALGAQDQDRFQRATAPEWQLVTGRGAKVDAARLLATHRERIKGFKLVATNMSIRVKNDVAWAVYEAEMSAHAQGQPWGGNFIVTNVLERRDGAWVCVHTQETRLATD